MKFLMIILSVMSFLVETKNSVKPDGIWPYNMEAVYSCTYQKGTVRKGDQATLSVSGLDGISIQKVSVLIKSTKQSGAGTFSVMADNLPIAIVPVSYQELNNESAYSSLELFLGECTDVDELTITLDGTENSLYIEQYEITWSNAAPRSVTLMNGAAEYAVMSERTAGNGIVLPLLPDTAEWTFVGWSEKEIRATTQRPVVMPAYSRFYPRRDTYLWATYKQSVSQDTTYMTVPESGVYLYVNRQMQIALSGTPENGIMYPEFLSTDDENQYYEITFTSPETAYITHEPTGTPIGYEGTKLAVKASPWQVYHNGEETLFYTTVNSKTYILWLNIMDAKEETLHTGLLLATLGNPSPMALMNLPEQSGEPLYTCHPENPQGITSVSAKNNTYSVPFGIYELRITNGQKQLIIK